MATPILSPELQSYIDSAFGDGSSNLAWATAWDQKNYLAALEHIEAAVSSSPEAVAPKLWWVRAQLQLNKVPLSALAASLDGIAPQAIGDAQLARTTLSTILGLTLRLVEKNQCRLALSLLQDSSKLAAADPTFSSSMRRALAEYLLELVRAELGRSETKRHATSYAQELRGKQKELEREIAELPKTTAKPAKKNRLDAKAIMEEALSESANSQEKIVPPSWAPDPKDQKDVFGLSTSAGSQSQRRQQLLRAAAAVAVCVLLLVVAWRYTFSRTEAGSGALLLAMNSSISRQAEPVLATLPILRGDQLSDKLAALNSNLEQVGARVKDLGSASKQSPGVSSAESSTNGEQVASKDVEVDHAALESKAAQKLKGNSAVEQIEPIDTSPKANLPTADPKKAPYLDPNRLANIPVDELGNSGPTAGARRPLDSPALQELRVGPDGRIYGPPSDVDIARREPGAKTLDGRAVQSYQVEEFPQAQNFRTIVPVQVLSAPSERAIPLSRLERDATIQVVSKMGPWLELRSTGGRRGYIFAQDAVPAE